MRKSRFVLCSLAVAALAVAGVLFISSAEGQFGGSPSTRLIDLTPAITTSTAVSTPVAPIPVGKQVKTFQRLIGVCKIVSAPSGGSGATLNVWFQYSADGGSTWQDFACVYAAQATGTYLVPVSVVAAGPTTVPSGSDGALANNTIVQGPLGDVLRVKYSAAMGTSTGNWSFQAFVVPD